MYVGISIVKKKRKKVYQGLQTSRVSSPILFPCLSSHLSIPVCVFVPWVACGAGAHGGSAGARGIGGGGGGGLVRQWQGGACKSMGEVRIDDVSVCNRVQTCL